MSNIEQFITRINWTSLNEFLFHNKLPSLIYSKSMVKNAVIQYPCENCLHILCYWCGTPEHCIHVCPFYRKPDAHIIRLQNITEKFIKILGTTIVKSYSHKKVKDLIDLSWVYLFETYVKRLQYIRNMAIIILYFFDILPSSVVINIFDFLLPNK